MNGKVKYILMIAKEKSTFGVYGKKIKARIALSVFALISFMMKIYLYKCDFCFYKGGIETV